MPSSNYQIIYTADGSPSLNWLTTGEAMHNRQGAFSESLAIYGQAILESIEMTGKAKILSVGLGLAYNEIIAAALSLKLKPQNIYMESFEEDESLRQSFLFWLESKDCELSEYYEHIMEMCSIEFDLPATEIKNFLLELKQKEQLILRKRLEKETEFPKKFHCLLYDPFSANTNPECWQEEFLENFLDKTCDKPCLFSTYAAKGTLKRSLLKKGFEVTTPEGFGGKRNRTYALKSCK